MNAKTKEDINNTFKDYNKKDLFCPECYNPLEETDEEVKINERDYKAGEVLTCPSSLCEESERYYKKDGKRLYGLYDYEKVTK